MDDEDGSAEGVVAPLVSTLMSLLGSVDVILLSLALSSVSDIVWTDKSF